jgi:hypothetical protein
MVAIDLAPRDPGIMMRATELQAAVDLLHASLAQAGPSANEPGGEAPA